MRTLRSHLRESLKDEKFRELYDEEKELLRLSLLLHEARQDAGVSQQAIARQAHLTQQQVSKIENGVNCTIMTYLKASQAVGFKLTLQPRGASRRALSRPRDLHRNRSRS